LPHIERVVRLAPYERAVRKMVLAIKFGKHWNLMPYVAEQMACVERVIEVVNDAEVVVPVPLHRWRLLSRGFNQAELLAMELLRGRSEPAVRCVLKRRRWTARQSRQSSATARARNLRDAFAVAHAEAVRGRRVMLVDDVLTSGATAVEAARTLKRAGAKEVSLLTMAVTDHPRYDE
jgi:ComF family protein